MYPGCQRFFSRWGARTRCSHSEFSGSTPEDVLICSLKASLVNFKLQKSTLLLGIPMELSSHMRNFVLKISFWECSLTFLKKKRIEQISRFKLMLLEQAIFNVPWVPEVFFSMGGKSWQASRQALLALTLLAAGEREDLWHIPGYIRCQWQPKKNSRKMLSYSHA